MGYSKFNLFPSANDGGGNYAVEFFQSSGGLPALDLIIGSDSVLIYPGQVLPVVERVTINTAITDDSLIRQNLSWFRPKHRVGTVQLANISTPELDREYSVEGEYYIEYSSQIIERKNYIVVVPPTDSSVGAVGNITNCNFSLVPGLILDSPAPLPIPSQGALIPYPYKSTGGAFNLQMERDTAILNGTAITYTPLIPGLAIRMFPGAVIQSVKHDVFFDGLVPHYYLPSPAHVCVQSVIDECAVEYATFIASSPSSRGYYVDLAECTIQLESALPVPGIEKRCIPRTWQCSTDPSVTHSGYQIGNFPITP